MIAHYAGVHGETSSYRLPADAHPAIFAYSLNRKLRYLYAGEYFRYRQESGGEYDYPTNTPDLSEDVYIVKIYDQKTSVDNIPVQDLVQSVEAKQAKLQSTSGGYVAVFDQKEYYDISSLLSYIDKDFTITALADGGNVPRPLVGIWGSDDIVTIEPSDLTTRFAFNSNTGAMLSEDGRVIQCFSGFDQAQNGSNIISIRNGSERALRVRPSVNSNFSHLNIGRQNERYYKGNLSEITMHSSKLTKVAANQIFQTTRTEYGD